MRYGYIRVSTKEQDETRQILAITNAGVAVENIFIDKSTGTTFIGREQWLKLLAKVVIGDIIVIKELDRLGRNSQEVKEAFELVNKKGVFLEFLEQPLLNTFGKSDIERELIQPLILHLLGYWAEKENEKRKLRQTEAYAALPVDEKGRKISRKTKKVLGRTNLYENLTSVQRRQIKAWLNKNISTKDCLELMKISRRSLYNLKKKLEGENMKLTLLWEHHDFDGISEDLFAFGIHKFDFTVNKKYNLLENFLNKLQKKITGYTFSLVIPDEKFEVIYKLFDKPSDYYFDCLVICPEEKIKHFGYFNITEDKKIVFYPIKEVEPKELTDRENNIINHN